MKEENKFKCKKCGIIKDKTKDFTTQITYVKIFDTVCKECRSKAAHKKYMNKRDDLIAKKPPKIDDDLYFQYISIMKIGSLHKEEKIIT